MKNACVVVFFVLSSCLSGCGGGDPTLEDFRVWATSYVAGSGANTEFEDVVDWFGDHFESDMAAKLAADYIRGSAPSSKLEEFLAAQKAKGRTDVIVRMADGPEDLGATGLQLAAIQSMTRKVPLFSLVMVSPGSEDGTSVWSFVWAEGDFKWVGKMARFNPIQGDMVTDILCSLPLRAAEERLQKQGFLDMPAVDYLKKVGVLR